MDMGRRMHSYFEQYYNWVEGDPPPFLADDPDVLDQFQQFARMTTKNGLIPYRTEMMVFSDKYPIAGTVDIIFKDKDEYHLYDWKRGSSVNDTTTEHGTGRFEGINASNLMKYSLQMHLYKKILEEYGITIKTMMIVAFKTGAKTHRTYTPLTAVVEPLNLMFPKWDSETDAKKAKKARVF